jgi:8-amino-7-oxononanoate synthase
MNAEQLRGWMVERISTALAVPPEEIDVNAPFADHGLDSVAALQLTGALEIVLNRSLSATVVFDYPTIETLARHLGA